MRLRCAGVEEIAADEEPAPSVPRRLGAALRVLVRWGRGGIMIAHGCVCGLGGNARGVVGVAGY